MKKKYFKVRWKGKVCMAGFPGFREGFIQILSHTDNLPGAANDNFHRDKYEYAYNVPTREVTRIQDKIVIGGTIIDNKESN